MYTYTRTPIYQASAQIQIEDENQKVVPFQEVTQREIGWDTSEYYQTQDKILQSRSLARRTLDSANLWTHPALGGSSGNRRAARGSRTAGRAPPFPKPPPRRR